MQLRNYQHKAIELLRGSLRKGHKRPILCMPTGSGKTNVAVEIIQSALNKGKRIGFIVERLTLLEQAITKLSEAGISPGVIQGTHDLEDSRKPVQVISAQTLASRVRKRHIPHLDLIFVDECHLVHKSVTNLMKSWDNIPIIGLSATPWTRGLGRYYQDLIMPVTTQQLIDQNYLVDSDYYAPVSFDDRGIKIEGGDYNQRQLGERVDKPQLIGDIVDHWRKLGNGLQTLCMATNIAHSKHIAKSFNSVGIKAAHVDCYSDTDERRTHFAAFERGDVRVLCSVAVLALGFDMPIAQVLISARPTHSRALFMQQCGRVARPYPGKYRAVIIDHSGNCLRLGFYTDPPPDHLDDGKPRVNGTRLPNDPPEKLPTVCPHCKILKPAGVWECPNCHFCPEKQNTITVTPGQLKPVRIRASIEEKKATYKALLKLADQKGYKRGWASHIYKQRFGIWPRFRLNQNEDSTDGKFK